MKDQYTYGDLYNGDDGKFHDIDMIDGQDDGDGMIVYQIYLRGMGIGVAEYDVMHGLWSTAYTPEGMVGGHSDKTAKSAKKLMKKIARQFHLK